MQLKKVFSSDVTRNSPLLDNGPNDRVHPHRRQAKDIPMTICQWSLSHVALRSPKSLLAQSMPKSASATTMSISNKHNQCCASCTNCLMQQLDHRMRD
jgi:hypothetical protein